MVYDAEKDAYTCAQGKNLQAAAVKKRRSETGYVQEVTVYECADCKGCPVKEQCIRQKKTDKKSLEDRVKRLNVSKYFIQQRKQRCTRGYKRYKETSGLIEWKDCQIFHSIFT